MPAAGLLDGNVTRENALLDGGGNAVVSEYLPERTAFDCGGRRCIGQSHARVHSRCDGFGRRAQTAGNSLPRRENQRRRSEEHTYELQSLMRISYAVFFLKQTTPRQQPH